MNEPKNILIIRTDRIGDVTLTLPLAHIIKDKYPKVRITFLVREYTEPLLRGHSLIDEVIPLPFKNGKIDTKKTISLLSSKNFDTAITVYPSFEIAYIIFRCGIKNRIGTGYRIYSFLFNEKVFEHRRNAERHELEYNVNLLKKIGIEYNITRSNAEFEINVDDKSKYFVKQKLMEKNYNFDLPAVIIHPGSGGSAVDYPLQKMKLLTERLSENFNINILITGAENEKEICDTVAGNSSAVNLAGEFNLSELIALINYSDLMIANSTGPIHIASALGKFVIGFYPKIPECSPKRWGPYTENSAVFTPQLDCKNCTRKQCGELNCMNTIETEKVTAKVEEFFSLRKGNYYSERD